MNRLSGLDDDLAGANHVALALCGLLALGAEVERALVRPAGDAPDGAAPVRPGEPPARSGEPPARSGEPPVPAPVDLVLLGLLAVRSSLVSALPAPPAARAARPGPPPEQGLLR